VFILVLCSLAGQAIGHFSSQGSLMAEPETIRSVSHRRIKMHLGKVLSKPHICTMELSACSSSGSVGGGRVPEEEGTGEQAGKYL
jgi:hypothetical protein